jgi:uncharacterized phiE125 gp8 family phage protein
MLTMSPPSVAAEAVDAFKTYARIDLHDEDPLIVAMLGAAIQHAESFTRQILLTRSGVERMNVSSQWQRLTATPVRSITGVAGIPAEGSSFTLLPGAYAVDIDSNGDGWVRVTQPGGAGRIDVAFTAGIASEWATLPEAISLGVLRLANHLFSTRDAPDDRGPPPAVAACLAPWRRIKL